MLFPKRLHAFLLMPIFMFLYGMKDFEIRVYGLQELGQAYFPHCTPHHASSQLKKWIMSAPRLLERLEATGYYHGQKILTPKQVRLIVEHLDPP